MANEQEPIAKRIGANLVEYVCPLCGWYDLTGVFREFLPFIDHLIRDYCFAHHPMLSRPIVQPNGIVWFQKPGTNELILGLPPYYPESQEWKALLGKKEKILPEANLFLPDIAHWVGRALISLDELASIRFSSIQTAERLLSLVECLKEEFQDQRNFLLNKKEALLSAGTDPKWTGKSGKQVSFIARSVSGARWGLSSSTSREMIRLIKASERKAAFEKLRISPAVFWWMPVDREKSI